MEVNKFADGHLDVPLAAGFVAVAARVTHRGHRALSANQVLRPTTARRYTERTEGQNGQEMIWLYLGLEQSGSV